MPGEKSRKLRTLGLEAVVRQKSRYLGLEGGSLGRMARLCSGGHEAQVVSGSPGEDRIFRRRVGS